MRKEVGKLKYDTFVLPYLETKDQALRKKAIETAIEIFERFIVSYAKRRYGKLGKYSIKTSVDDIKATAYCAIAGHLIQANPVDYLMFCKYMQTWVRKEVSAACHFEEGFLCTFSDISDEQNVYEVADGSADTEKDALFREVFDMMRELIDELPPHIRDSLTASYIREDSTWVMKERLNHYTSASSYLQALKKAVPLLKELIVDRYGWKGYMELEEFFRGEDFS